MKHFFCKTLSILLLLSSASVSKAVVDGCSADYIIVGAGTSGPIMARYLSDTSSVLLLEAGENLSTDPLVLSPSPVTAISTWNTPKYSLNPSAYNGLLNGPAIPTPYSIGRMWGGSGAHNNMLTIRGSTDLWDYYGTASGNSQWAYANILPVMLFLEQYTPSGTTANYNQRGQNGAWYITQQAFSSMSTLFPPVYAGIIGVTIVADYNDPTNAGANPAPNYLNVGVSSNQLSTTPPGPDQERSFSINAYMNDTIVDADGIGVNGRKLRVLSSATVTRVLLSGTKAIGVEYILEGNPEQVFQVFAKKEVILSAGAIYTPAILQRSGIGSAADRVVGGITYPGLDTLGIPVVIDSPHVGANLQNHFGPTALVSTPASAFPIGVFGEAFFGISSPTIREIQTFFQRGTLLFPNAELARQLGVSPLGATGNYISLPFQLVKNNSRGIVQIVSTDPLTAPLIDFAFYKPTADVPNNDDPTVPGTDAYNAVQCLRIIEAFNTTVGYSVVYPTAADYAGTDLQLFNNVVRNTYLIQDHATCTCRMGTDISNGVVDANGKVFGAQNLRIVDDSICPRINTGNTQYQAYVLPLRIAKNMGANLPF